MMIGESFPDFGYGRSNDEPNVSLAYYLTLVADKCSTDTAGPGVLIQGFKITKGTYFFLNDPVYLNAIASFQSAPRKLRFGRDASIGS